MIGKWDEKKRFDYENGFYLTSETYRFGNWMAHYELYKKILELPGDVIELGVFKGGGVIQFATFRELLENENSRKIIGFDIFGKFPQGEKLESDRHFVDQWNEQFEGEFLSKEDIYRSLEIKGIQNVQLIEGDICTTVEKYLEKHPQTKISLLHIDVDIYEPAKVGLDKLFDRVVKGGVIVFDDYGCIEGETVAVDEFLSNREYTIRKFPFSHAKPSYIIKK